MSLEVIKCPSCGSSEVTEYKADSYICRHCDTAFKHVDPSPVTVTVRSDFCRCGNLPHGQCGTCRSGICQRCVGSRADAGQHDDPLRSIGGWYSVVAVKSGGYQLEVGYRSLDFFSSMTAVGISLNCRDKALEDGDWRPLQVDDSKLISGYIPIGKVQDYLRCSGVKGYVCLSCFSEAGERVCAELTSSAMCANPFCGRPGSSMCPCCHEPNCGECLYASLSGYSCPPEFIRALEKDNPQAVINAPAVCAPCYPEYKRTPSELTWIPEPSQKLSSKAFQRASSERRLIIAQRALEISVRLWQQVNEGCHRSYDSPTGTIRYQVVEPR
jgi:hypothetical protein